MIYSAFWAYRPIALYHPFISGSPPRLGTSNSRNLSELKYMPATHKSMESNCSLGAERYRSTLFRSSVCSKEIANATFLIMVVALCHNNTMNTERMTIDRPYTATTIDDVWLPGKSLNEHYRIPTDEQLAAELGRGRRGEYAALSNVFGSVRVPAEHERIEAVISLDLCEVIRLTAQAIAATGGKDFFDSNDYIKGLWEDERFHGEIEPDYAYYTLQPIAQVMINNDLVDPVAGADEIYGILKRWQQNGAYCVANTSTLPGCELGTVQFLNKHYPGCFDGIVFPRNHDGTSPLTKADALSEVLNELAAQGHTPKYAMHIDDTVHHIQGMLEKSPHPQTFCFLPIYPGCVAIDSLAAEVKRANSPLETFRLMDDQMTKMSIAA